MTHDFRKIIKTLIAASLLMMPFSLVPAFASDWLALESEVQGGRTLRYERM
jgi:hypothetical protein